MKDCRMTRGAGILLAITSLPSPYGIGTMGKAAFKFVDMLADLRQKYWQVLPIGPTGFGDSPYQSFSAFAGNPYLIDLDFLIAEGLLKQEEADACCWGEKKDDVDYALIYTNRFTVLKSAFGRFDREDEAFKIFCEENKDWLEDYSLYMAIKDEMGGCEWLSWDEGLKDREPETLERYKELLKEQTAFWRFLQYKFFEQWKALKAYANEHGVKIIGDIPLYLSLDSADVWANREQFRLDEGGRPVEVAGCPPDAFSEDGQKWGNPLYDWEKMKEDVFSWWQRRIEANGRLFDIIRIDHFIGVARYYSVPASDETARNGRWNKGPGRMLTDVIEKTLGKNRVIAEDLGVALPTVKRLLAKTGWPGMKMLMFGFDGDTANEHLPHNYYDGNLVVYAGTHDSETVVGYFRDKAEYELAYLYKYLRIQTKEEIPDAIIQTAYASVADIVIIQMQDLLKLGNETRMNFPSTVGKNWRWRTLAGSLDEERQNWLRTMTLLYRR